MTVAELIEKLKAMPNLHGHLVEMALTEHTLIIEVRDPLAPDVRKIAHDVAKKVDWAELARVTFRSQT